MHKPVTAKLPSLATKSRSHQFDSSKNATKQNTATTRMSFCCEHTDTDRRHGALTPRPPSFPRTRRENSLRARSCSAPIAVKPNPLIKSQSFPDQIAFSSLNKSAFYNWKISEPSRVPATRKFKQAEGGALCLAGVSSKAGQQRTDGCVIQKSLNRPGTPIFKTRESALKKGEISVDSLFVTAKTESPKWQLCDITEFQNKQEENSDCFVDNFNIEAIHKAQQSSDSSKTGRRTYVNEDNQNRDARTSQNLQKHSLELQGDKDSGYVLAESQIDSLPVNLKSEKRVDFLFGVAHSFANNVHSCSCSFCTFDSEEENDKLVCESNIDKQYCCKEHQKEEESSFGEEEEEYVKRTRISDWIVQVSEETKYVK